MIQWNGRHRGGKNGALEAGQQEFESEGYDTHQETIPILILEGSQDEGLKMEDESESEA